MFSQSAATGVSRRSGLSVSTEPPQVIVSFSPSRAKIESTPSPPLTASWPRPPSIEVLTAPIARSVSPPAFPMIVRVPSGELRVTLRNSRTSAADPPIRVSTLSRPSDSPAAPSSLLPVVPTVAFSETAAVRAE